MPNDGGAFVFSSLEKNKLEAIDQRVSSFFKMFLGAEEFIDGKDRFALWIDEQSVSKAMKIPQIRERIKQVERTRNCSSREATKKLAKVPYRFGEVRYKPTDSIIVPSVSSERREYIPMGYLGPDSVISNAAFAIYDAEPWLFALLTSKIHMAWTRAVGGKMKTDYRYSNTIVYNNFPVPELSERQKQELTDLALRVLDVREYHCDKTLAQLYDPDLMPDNLRQAHHEIDMYVDSLYSKRKYETDEERLSDLFAMYEEMVAAEEAAKPKKKTRKQKK